MRAGGKYREGCEGSLQLRHLSELYSTDITFFIVPKRGLYRGCGAWCCGVRNALSRLTFPYWDGARVSLAYNEKPISHDATVLFQSLSLKNEKDAAEKAKARKGASGLELGAGILTVKDKHQKEA